MSEVLDRVRDLKQQVEEKNRDRLRLEAERDAAAAHHREALEALQRFGVASVADAEARVGQMEVAIEEELKLLTEALG